MNIEELAFKDRKNLANLNEIDLLDIIEFLQEDRNQWINQFTKTHNENVEIQKENDELKSQLASTTHCFDEEEHERLKKQLHEASIKIQEMTEQDIECPSNCEKLKKLKKQLEEWEHHLKCSKEMLDIQAQKGNYDYDEYMLGLYNGMEYIISLFETREPNYINGKDVEFTNNKTQQKKFINYLEDEKDRLIKGTSHYYIDSFDRQHAVNETVYDEVDIILQKYKEIIGDDK